MVTSFRSHAMPSFHLIEISLYSFIVAFYDAYPNATKKHCGNCPTHDQCFYMGAIDQDIFDIRHFSTSCPLIAGIKLLFFSESSWMDLIGEKYLQPLDKCHVIVGLAFNKESC